MVFKTPNIYNPTEIKIEEIIIKVSLIKSSLLIKLSSEYFQVQSCLVDIASKPKFAFVVLIYHFK